MQPETDRCRGPEPDIPRVWYKYNADRLQCVIASITAQAEAQLAQQQLDAQPAAAPPPSSAFDMSFDCLGLDMAPAVTATTATTALPPTSPILSGNPPFSRGFLPNGMLGDPLSDMDMADSFLLDTHADWYAPRFPTALVRRAD